MTAQAILAASTICFSNRAQVSAGSRFLAFSIKEKCASAAFVGRQFILEN